ncbi:MAG: DUF5329 family protein, partial [Deltaproteobacteria bacterium]|nr:DUF5329 family protein [Nannocystaceae bacterium]
MVVAMRSCDGCVRPSVVQTGSTRAVGVLAGWLVFLPLACGTPNPREVDETEQQVEPQRTVRDHDGTSEVDKIHKLIEVVRGCDATFVHPEGIHDGEAEAALLDHRVSRMSVSTARQFVDVLGAARQGKGSEVKVRLADGAELPAKEWYLARLEEIEGVPTSARRAQQLSSNLPVTLGILDALTIVERSNERFVAPARTLPNGKTKGKRKEYDSSEFAEMLRKKWEFLGADVRDLDAFIEEIA